MKNFNYLLKSDPLPQPFELKLSFLFRKIIAVKKTIYPFASALRVAEVYRIKSFFESNSLWINNSESFYLVCRWLAAAGIEPLFELPRFGVEQVSRLWREPPWFISRIFMIKNFMKNGRFLN